MSRSDPEGTEDPACEETAGAIRDSGLLLSCHTNYQRALRPDGALCPERMQRLHDQVHWWHAQVGVYSACADPLVTSAAGGENVFAVEVNRAAMVMAADAFRSVGIRFGWENSFGPPDRCQSAADINRFAQACAMPGLGLLLDLGHLNIHLHSPDATTRDPEAFIRALDVEIHEVHVTDNLGQKDEHRHLGYGNLDLAAVMRGLLAVGYRGPLVVEVCIDILNGHFAADIGDADATAPILDTRRRLAEAVVATAA